MVRAHLMCVLCVVLIVICCVVAKSIASNVVVAEVGVSRDEELVTTTSWLR